MARTKPRAPKHHWSGWYAAYVVARERGRTPEDAARDATRHIEGALAAQRRSAGFLLTCELRAPGYTLRRFAHCARSLRAFNWPP